MAKKSKVPTPDPDGILRTGIYQRRVGRAPRLTDDEVEAALDRMVEDLGKPAIESLSEIREWLKPIAMAVLEGPLEKDKTSPAPGATYRNLDLGEGPQIFRVRLPENGSVETEQALNAIEALDEIRVVELNVGSNQDFLFRATLRLGRLIERIHVRRHEPHAQCGHKVLEAASAGGKLNASLTPEQKKEAAEKVAALISEGESQNVACATVGKGYKRSKETIARAYRASKGN